MTDDVALAETVTGLGLFVTGVVAAYVGAYLPASVCFATVGLIACARSYTRMRGSQYE